MPQELAVGKLHEELLRHVECRWLAGEGGNGRKLRPPRLGERIALLGHLNLIHPNQIQVLGATELAWLKGLRKNSRDDALEQLVSSGTRIILLCENLDPPDDLKHRAEQHRVPLWQTPIVSYEAITLLRHILSSRLAEQATLHGVFLEVLGIGVLIAGDARVGKSELALELISRGHRLVADDAPLFARTAPDTLEGSAPPALQDFLEVRGLGVLDIRAMYGDNAIKQRKYLRLIIRLVDLDEVQGQETRLQGMHSLREILEVPIPEITLPVAPGRNLAVLVEAAVRDHLLRSGGYDAATRFIERQQRLIGDEDKCEGASQG